MAKRKGGLGRGLDWIFSQDPGPTYHPILSPIQFKQKAAEGGVSMDPRTGETVDTNDPSQDTHFVGGAPSASGEPIQTRSFDPDGTLLSVAKLRREIKQAGRPNVNIGGWVNQGTGITELDASDSIPDADEAMETLKSRPQEEAMFSTKKFRESGEDFDGDIKNPNFDPKVKAKLKNPNKSN